MRIGLDFDNTIVSYDALFHKVALEQGHIPATTPLNKNAVRDHMRAQGNEDAWTAMQGYVYGARMQEAAAYARAVDVMQALKQAGHQLFIISHKTRTPYAGPAYDLHESARGWIATHLMDNNAAPIFAANDVYFHETKEQKIARISELKCDVFLDDLPEILLHKNFPTDVKRFLFSTAGTAQSEWTVVDSWSAFEQVVSGA